ncbi:LysE family translocator [Herbaspirillum lusitanum]|uniref:LysE family translocator n=1 Tax=Herbaspirillum lusitanum TaxID=213312 RepID=A0ABW9AEI4_9BURK
MSHAALFDWPAILAVLSASAIGVAIPGANFVAIANKALDSSRGEAICMSFGFAVVNSLWAICGIFGAGAIIVRYDWLGPVLKGLGCAYLIWFGLRLLIVTQQAALPDTGAASGAKNAFCRGIASNIVNPKSLLYYCAVLSNLVPSTSSSATVAAMIVTVGACAVIWYSGLSFLLSFSPISSGLRRHFRNINRLCGAVLVTAGLLELLEVLGK